MDRNDRIKQKYYEKMPNNTKVSFTGNFDPVPYVDMIFEQMEESDNEGVDPNDFKSSIMETPRLAIIFGKGSALNIAQKAMVIEHLEERIRIAKDFDPTPYVNKLNELYTKKEFGQFEKVDSDGDTIFDFDNYFKDQNFTKEQLAIVESEFFNRQSVRAKTLRKKFIPAFIVSAFFIIVPPFFIPNILQSIGFISNDAGWFTKIGIGILSLVLLFFLSRKLFSLYANNFLKPKNLLLVEDKK